MVFGMVWEGFVIPNRSQIDEQSEQMFDRSCSARTKASRHRASRRIVFFIFLVANIGGSLTPLGDPPLFLGFLKGVSFFWTTTAMFKPMLFMVISLAIIYFIIDSYLFNREQPIEDDGEIHKLGLEGSFNLLLLCGVIASVLLSGFWHPDVHFSVYHVRVELQSHQSYCNIYMER